MYEPIEVMETGSFLAICGRYRALFTLGTKEVKRRSLVVIFNRIRGRI